MPSSSLDSLSSPSPSPSPPPAGRTGAPGPGPSALRQAATASGPSGDSGSELSELTEDDEPGGARVGGAKKRRGGGAKKRGAGLIPPPPWGWAIKRGAHPGDAAGPAQDADDAEDIVMDQPFARAERRRAPTSRGVPGRGPDDGDEDDEDAFTDDEGEDEVDDLALPTLPARPVAYPPPGAGEEEDEEDDDVATDEEDLEDEELDEEDDSLVPIAVSVSKTTEGYEDEEDDDDEMAGAVTLGDVTVSGLVASPGVPSALGALAVAATEILDAEGAAVSLLSAPLPPAVAAGSSIMAGSNVAIAASPSPSTSTSATPSPSPSPPPERRQKPASARKTDKDKDTIPSPKRGKGDEDEQEPDVDVDDDADAEIEPDQDLQPAHRAEALDVLAHIELKFALLRDKLYLEKMEDLAWEHNLVEDGEDVRLLVEKPYSRPGRNPPGDDSPARRALSAPRSAPAARAEKEGAGHRMRKAASNHGRVGRLERLDGMVCRSRHGRVLRFSLAVPPGRAANGHDCRDKP
jgi:hypothetical protein